MLSFKEFYSDGHIEDRVGGLMAQFQCYWLLPNGEFVRVPFANHDGYVKEHPEQFNISPDELQAGQYFIYKTALERGAARIGVKNELVDVQPLDRNMLRKLAPRIYAFCKEDDRISYVNVSTLEGDFRKLVPIERFRMLF